MLHIGTVHDFATCLNNDGHINALFLDLAKTFDKSFTSVYVQNYHTIAIAMELIE